MRAWLAADAHAHIFQHDHAHLFDWRALALQAQRGSGREYRVVHMIRDPRSIIVSSYMYNRNTSEPWAGVRQQRLGNVSYRDLLSRLPASQGVLVEASRLLYGQIWLPGRPLPMPPGVRCADGTAAMTARRMCIAVGAALRCERAPVAFASCTCGCIAPLQGMLRVMRTMHGDPAVLTVCLEEFASHYDETVAAIVQHVGLSGVSDPVRPPPSS